MGGTIRSLTLWLVFAWGAACGDDDGGSCPTPSGPAATCGFVGAPDLAGRGQLRHVVFGDGVVYGVGSRLEVIVPDSEGTMVTAVPVTPTSLDAMGAMGLAVADELAFVIEQFRLTPTENLNQRLRIADVSEPSAPRWLSELELVRGQTAAHIAVAGDHAYVWLGVGGEPRLAIVDVSDPSAPSLVNTVESSLPSYVNDVEIIGDRLYATGWNSVSDLDGGEVSFRLVAFDISTPDAPEVLSVPVGPVGGRQVPNVELAPAGEGRVLVIGSTIAGTLGDGGPQGALFVVDVTGTGSVMTSLPLEGTAVWGLDGDGATAVARTSRGPVTIDLTDAAFPVLGAFGPVPPDDLPSHALTVEGTTARWVEGDVMRTFDVSDPAAAPREVESVSFPRTPERTTFAIAWASADTVVVADGAGGVALFDGCDLARPREVGRLDLDVSVESIEANERYAVVAGRGPPHYVLDIADPAAPALVGEGRITGSMPRAPVLVGANVFVIDGPQVAVYDLEGSLSEPIRRFDLPDDWPDYGLTAAGDRVVAFPHYQSPSSVAVFGAAGSADPRLETAFELRDSVVFTGGSEHVAVSTNGETRVLPNARLAELPGALEDAPILEGGERLVQVSRHGPSRLSFVDDEWVAHLFALDEGDIRPFAEMRAYRGAMLMAGDRAVMLGDLFRTFSLATCGGE